jgi:hypothetical protein
LKIDDAGKAEKIKSSIPSGISKIIKNFKSNQKN